MGLFSSLLLQQQAEEMIGAYGEAEATLFVTTQSPEFKNRPIFK